jgi:hypothetical protein
MDVNILLYFVHDFPKVLNFWKVRSKGIFFNKSRTELVFQYGFYPSPKESFGQYFQVF